MHVTIAALRSSDFNGGVYWHMLTSFPFLTILQTSKAVVGKCRTYITAWFGVVMRNAQPYSLCLHLAAAAAALHGRISNHVLVASASFLLDQVNRGSILIAAFSIKLR